MKKIYLLLTFMILASIFLIGCSSQKQNQTKLNDKQEKQMINTNIANASAGKKALIVYYSISGNTQAVANQIQKNVGGDIVQIETVSAYPSNYNQLTQQAKKEIQEGFKPQIRPINVNLNDYDVIYLGSPNWWSTIAPPVMSFLSQNDLSGKTIYPFITHGGGGLAGCEKAIKELAANANVKNALVIRDRSSANVQNDIANWLN